MAIKDEIAAQFDATEYPDARDLVGEAMYKAAAQQQAAQAPPPSQHEPPKGDDDVIDAEYEVKE